MLLLAAARQEVCHTVASAGPMLLAISAALSVAAIAPFVDLTASQSAVAVKHAAQLLTVEVFVGQVVEDHPGLDLDCKGQAVVDHVCLLLAEWDDIVRTAVVYSNKPGHL